MASEKQIELSWLFPDFSNLTFFPQTSVELSSFFVIFLWIVTFIASVVFLNKYARSKERLDWLYGLLNELERDDIAHRREDLLNEAKKRDKDIGFLWMEFDETLVEVQKNDRIEIRNTLDAAHFFNTHTLASGVTENRLVAAVPGFLTALGVIGTFIGLQLGLSQLELGAGVDVNEMQDGVAGVVEGAKIAFLTSVWGVFLSVIFNFGEKWLEQSTRKKIRSIEYIVDKLFPRIRPEEQLQNISENSNESREVLQGLAEQIGERMQEAVVTATQGIQSSLENSLSEIMAPAINKLVETTSEGNQKALEGLLENFMEGFGRAGNQQRDALDDVSIRVNSAVDSMQTTMSNFVEQLQKSQAESGDREKALIADISNQVSGLTSQSEAIHEKLTRFVENHVDEMSSQMQKREDASAKRDTELVQTIKSQVDELIENSRYQGETLTNFVQTQLNGLTQSFNERDAKVKDIEDERLRAYEARSDEFQKKLSSFFESQISSMGSQIETREQASADREKELVSVIRAQIDELVNNSRAQGETLTSFVESQLSGLTKNFDEREKRSNELEQARNLKIEQQTQAISSLSNEILRSVEKSVSDQVATVKQLIAQGQTLQNSINSSVDASAQATQAMRESSTELRVSADNMRVLSSHVNDAGNKLSGAIKEAVESTADLANQNQMSAEKMEILREELLSDVSRFGQLTTQLNELIESAGSTFSELKFSQKQFIAELNSEVEKLNRNMTQQLEDYAEQANGQTAAHLKVWSQSVHEYSTQMNNAVKALSSVVDEMQVKLG
ncbi:anti-phage ZorAB system protein ZorA [Alteromonas sp. 14N.309.X.WAT.G.H12]|uniref:anti-phage ZorAB system protein ZorA n=1 Tax=Alteromonas sp. 14N.309.X.WAT.G.H12 TaxID=3120824 RepID=UPI002FD43140